MATRYLVGLPTMGIAFMVLASFLYPDVTESLGAWLARRFFGVFIMEFGT